MENNGKPIYTFIIDSCTVQGGSNIVEILQTRDEDRIEEAYKKLQTRMICIKGLEKHGDVKIIPEIGRELRHTFAYMKEETREMGRTEISEAFGEMLTWLDERMIDWRKMRDYALLMGKQLFAAGKGHVADKRKMKYGDYEQTDRHIIATVGAVGHTSPVVVCTHDSRLQTSLDDIVPQTIRELQAQEIMPFPLGRYIFATNQENYEPGKGMHIFYRPKKKR